VKDSASSRRYLSPTEVTGIDFPICNLMMFCNSLAIIAEDTIRPSGILNKLQAGIIIRELLSKVFNRVAFHCFSPVFNFNRSIA